MSNYAEIPDIFHLLFSSKLGGAKVYIYSQLAAFLAVINAMLTNKKRSFVIRMEKTVCHISYNHDPFDDRIYWKELLTLKEAGYKTIHLCVGGKDLDFISKEGVRIVQVKRRKSTVNIWLNRIYQICLKKEGTIDDVMKKAEVLTADIYHYHDLQINALVKNLKRLPHKPKVIYDIHEIYWLLVKNDKPKSFFKKAFLHFYSFILKQWELNQSSYCDYLILTVDYLYEFFEKKQPRLHKSIIYNYSFFNIHEALPRRKEYDFIYAGLIDKTRGIEELIAACAKLKTSVPEFKCLVIGPIVNEVYLNHLQNLIEEMNLSNHVILHKQVPFEKIKEFYLQSRVGLGLYYHTQNYTNAIAIKLFEYMAFGLPVIFANHGTFAKVIKKEDCGILVDIKHNPAIVSAMEALLTDYNLYQKFSNNGANAIKNTYNWNNEKKKLLSIYQKLFNQE